MNGRDREGGEGREEDHVHYFVIQLRLSRVYSAIVVTDAYMTVRVY